MANFDPDVILLLIGLGIVCTTVVAIVSLKRRKPPEGLPAADFNDIREQLSRLEQAVDSIALETERISEGQRFTTRILAESGRVPLPSDAAKRPAS